MFIKSLHLTNFKRFKRLDIEFPDDISVIQGPNEQGKSTIVQALIAALFYDPGKSNEAIKNCRAWGCDKFYTVKLEFEANAEDFILEKDFEKKTIALKNNSSDEIIDEYKEITRRLTQFGGYQTPELFFSTACVKQGELVVLDKGENITQALQDLISGGGAMVSLIGIFKRIEKAQDVLKRGLERGLAKNPGQILRLKNELAEKSKMLEEKKRIFKEEDVASQSLGKLRTEREKTQSELDIKTRVYNESTAYVEITRVLGGLNAEHEAISKTLETISNLTKERDLFKQEEGNLKKIGEIDSRQFYDAANEIERLSARISELTLDIEVMSKKGIEFREVLNAQYLIIAGAFIGLGFLGFFFHKLFFLGWGLFGLLSFWLAFSKSVFRKITRKKLEKDCNAAKNEKGQKELGLNAKLNGLGLNRVEDIEKKRNLWRDLQNKTANIDSKIEGILGEGTLSRLMQQRRELEKRIGVEETKLEKYKGARMPTREEQMIFEREIEHARKTLYDLEKKISGVEALLAQAKAPYEEITRLEERIYTLDEELCRALGREKMLAALDASLRDAQQKTFSSTRKTLEQYIGEFLSEITEGKYSSISIGPNMKIKVFSTEKNAEIEPEGNLSTGALEQLYLVARFALISLLYSSASRPLVVLDDPFGNFDAKRKAKARHILKKLSQKFQILLLTCSKEYSKWGKVVDLATVE